MVVLDNFYNQLWYTPQSERESVRPARFLIQSPSYKLYTLIGKPLNVSGATQEYIDHQILRHCIVSMENTEGLTDPSELPLEIQQDILAKIIELFYPTENFFQSMNISLDLVLDNKVSGDSWDCSVCQSKKLDRQRNCPYLDKEEYHEDTFKLSIGSEIYYECPIPKKDNNLLGKAFEAHRIADSGNLPEVGAYGDQTIFWVLASQRVKEKINYYERKELEDQRKELKR